MILFWQNHRLGQKPEFVFVVSDPEKTKGIESPKGEEGKSEFLEWFKGKNKDSKELEASVDEWLESKYGPKEEYGEETKAVVAEFKKGLEKRFSDYREQLEKSKEDTKARLESVKKSINFSKILNANNGEEILKMIEGGDLFTQRELAEASSAMAESVINRVQRDGADTKFVEAVKGETKRDVKDFDDACSIFEKELKKQAEGGFRQGYEFAKKISETVFGDPQEAKGLDSQSPAFKGMVQTERDNFLGGRTKPGNVDDIRLLAFMKLNTREEREAALVNPTESAALFQSVQTIKNRENGKEWKEWADKLPKPKDQPKELRTSGERVESPSTHDMIARQFAIVGLAREAEFMIQNLATTEDLKGSDLEKRIAEANEKADREKNPAPTDYRFKDNFRQAKSRYLTEAERAGFNRRDIGFALLQTWGVITFLLNAKNSWSGIKNIDEMLGKMAKNPFIYLSGGAVLGPHALKKDPEALDYLTQSEGGKKRIVEHWKLHDIKDKVGYTSLKNYIANGEEAAAMKSLYEKDPKRKGLEKALAKAEERNWKERGEKLNWQVPSLEKEDWPEPKSESPLNSLPETTDPSQKRIRYLFYKKFLTDPKVNLEQLRTNCQNWQG